MLSRVPETTSSEFEQAVEAAKEAFKTWSRTSVLTRQRFVLEYAFPPLPYAQVIDPVITFLDFRLKYVKMQTLLPTPSFLSKERLLPVSHLARDCLSAHLLVLTQMRTVTSFEVFRWSKPLVTSQRP